MAELPDVRIGDLYYQLEQVDDPSSVSMAFRRPTMERDWASLFAAQQVPSGKPSIENLRNDDLRWFLDDFSGGEGQVVLRAGDAAGEKRYAKSVGVDLSQPGQFTLSKEMRQQGGTGAATTTFQGSTFVNVIGTATTVGTDRRLDNLGDQLKHNVTPAAGTYLADFYGYVNTAGEQDGSSLNVDMGQAPIVGTTRHLADGASVSRTVTAPTSAKGTVAFTLSTTTPPDLFVTGQFHILVRNATDTKTIAETGPVTIRGGNPHDPANARLSWTAASGTDYKVRIKWASVSPNFRLVVESFHTSYADTKTMQCQIYNETASSAVATANVDIGGVVATQRITSLSWIADGTSQYSFRVKRQAGASIEQFVDKVQYALVSLATPWNVDLGQGNKMWLFDRGAGLMPGAFTWDPQNEEWVAIGRIAGSGNSTAQHTAHSDYYEYLLVGNGQVWIFRPPGTVTQYTAAFTNQAGIAVGANRLYVLTEDTTGTKLYELAVDDAASAPIAVPGAASYEVGGVTAKAKMEGNDTTEVRRIVGVADGCAFFVNHGSHCVLYHFTSGAAGVPVTDFPLGFRARALATNLGLVYVAGNFPQVDSDGTTRYRPAVFIVDLSSGSAPQQLDVNLYRTSDGDAQVQDIQLYGSDLWVLTQQNPANGSKKFRVWRVSLTISGGTFLTQEVVVDESMQSGNLRAFAVDWHEKIVVWGSGNGAPYVEQDNYITSGTAYLESSIFDFALTEEKILLAMSVNGNFPDDTAADLFYSTDDGGTWVLAGTRDSAGSVQVSDVDTSVTFRRLAMRCEPRTANPAATPTISQFSARAYLVEYQKTWDLLLDCRGETPTYHTSGQQLTGFDLASNLLSLADAGDLVEFEDFYSSHRPEDSQVHRVIVTNPQQVFFAKGDSVVKVTLVER